MQTPDDVNLPPLCHTLSLPCGSPRTMPDFGVGLSLARNLTEHVALAGEVSAYGNHWVAFEPARLSPGCGGNVAPFECTEVNKVLALMVGPRISTRFLHVDRYGSPVRLFGQVLIGPEVSDLVPARRAIQPGGGVDIGNGNMSARLEIDHRFTSGGGRNLSTGRFVVALVLGFSDP